MDCLKTQMEFANLFFIPFFVRLSQNGGKAWERYFSVPPGKAYQWRQFMRVLITGASGFIGSHIAARLIMAGHEVVGCVRNVKTAKRTIPNIELVEGNFSSDHTSSVWLPRLQGIDAVINAVGIISENSRNTFKALHTDAPKALFEACAAAGVKKAIQISALGADEHATSRYHLSKKAADDYLAKLDLDWIILQPSVVYGRGGKSAAFFMAISALPAIPLIGDGSYKLQPICVDDLADAILKLLELPCRRLRLEAVGPEPLTFADMLAAYREWLGFKKTFFLRIPLPLVRMASWFGNFIGGSPMNSEALDMLMRGNVGNPTSLMQVAGVKPKGLRYALSLTPCRQADRWYAGLYFIKPVLRLSIALVWIAAGITSAFLFPMEKSYELLERVGISGDMKPLMLYGASALDFMLGAAILIGYRIRLVGMVQLILISAYSIIITLKLPEFLFHPFGPVVKNIPIMTAILTMMALEEEE